MDNGKQPAFPTTTNPGLTKRENLAAMAMQGLLAAETVDAYYPNPERLAKAALENADALLAALDSIPAPEHVHVDL